MATRSREIRDSSPEEWASIILNINCLAAIERNRYRKPRRL